MNLLNEYRLIMMGEQSIGSLLGNPPNNLKDYALFILKHLNI